MGKQAKEEDGRVFPAYLDLSVYIRECGGKKTAASHHLKLIRQIIYYRIYGSKYHYERYYR